MKVVFPCTGALVLLKQDLEILQSFYNSNLTNSKIYETYKSSNITVQVGNFNYMPPKASIILYNANPLTINTMRQILGIYKETLPPPPPPTTEDTTPISDNDLLSNPFFQTLHPLN